jgi:hypothetical protein
MTDYEDMKRGVSREWAAARIVLIGGFVVAVAVTSYILWQRHEADVTAQQQAVTAQEQAVAAENAKAGMVLCAMELASAKSMGIIPAYGQLTTAAPESTAQRGRYTCTAATPSLKYVIAADLVCRKLTDPACVKIHSIKTDDGTTLFQQK